LNTFLDLPTVWPTYQLYTLSPANKNSPHSWRQKSETKSRRKIHIQQYTVMNSHLHKVPN